VVARASASAGGVRAAPPFYQLGDNLSALSPVILRSYRPASTKQTQLTSYRSPRLRATELMDEGQELLAKQGIDGRRYDNYQLD
jgi:hypothetical protein